VNRNHLYKYDLQIQKSGTAPGVYELSLPDLPAGDYTLTFLFTAAAYPFEQHCRYVRHRDAESSYTFPNMEFAETPPGLRVGPWPGWRGIPAFPEIVLTIGNMTWRVDLHVWGDEMIQRHIRGVAEVALPVRPEIKLTVADSRLFPVKAAAYPTTFLHASPLPVELLPELQNAHPRLLISPSSIDKFRSHSQGTHRKQWNKLVGLLENWPLPFARTPESKTVPGPERLSSEDRVLVSALICLVDPSSQNVSRAREAFFMFLSETRQPGFEPLNIDTQCGETLFILCCGYDWLFGHLSGAERADVESELGMVADRCWSHLGYERHDYAQAHYLGCGLGLLAFSFLFWGTHPRAHEWACHLGGVLKAVRSVLPDDGFYPHGINLWIYEYGFLLRWLELMRECAGLDLWGSAEHWTNTSRFRGAATTPDTLCGMTFGDPQFRTGGDSWCHYLIAARTGAGDAQHLGESLSESPHEGVDYRSVCARRRVYEFLFYDERVRPVSSEPRAHIFPDGGQVFVRSESDSPAVFTFRAGPPLGVTRYGRGIHGGYGHSDPSNGSFLLYAGGGFLISGPGPTYRRETTLHNTITSSGSGQIGDTTVWLPDFFPPENLACAAKFRTDGRHVLISADLTRAYLPYLGVDACRRTMCVNADLSILCLDTVECRVPTTVVWNLHSWYPFHELDAGASKAFRFGMKDDEWRISLLEPKAANWTTGLTEMVPAYPHDGRRDYFLRATTVGRHVQFVWWVGNARRKIPTIVSNPEAPLELMLDSDSKVHFDGEWLAPDSFIDET
jgi:hypothetical protein